MATQAAWDALKTKINSGLDQPLMLDNTEVAVLCSAAQRGVLRELDVKGIKRLTPFADQSHASSYEITYWARAELKHSNRMGFKIKKSFHYLPCYLLNATKGRAINAGDSACDNCARGNGFFKRYISFNHPDVLPKTLETCGIMAPITRDGASRE
jgi:hypothetical protein